MNLQNEKTYAQKIFELVHNMLAAKKQLKEKYNIDAEVRDCTTLVIESFGQLNESMQTDAIQTVYKLCPKDMVDVEFI